MKQRNKHQESKPTSWIDEYARHPEMALYIITAMQVQLDFYEAMLEVFAKYKYSKR